MYKLDEMIEKIEEALYGQMSNGIEQVDTEEFGKVADIFKDLMSAKKNCYKAKYYESVVDAMEEASEDDEDGEHKYYSARMRDRRGRYTSRRGYDMDMDVEEYERMRDMDRKGYNRMYFSEPVVYDAVTKVPTTPPMAYTEMASRYYTDGNRGGMRDTREGKSGMSRRGYVESKEMHNSGSESDKMMNRKELEKWVDDIGQDVKELVPTMTPEERTSLKTKMTNLVNAL